MREWGWTNPVLCAEDGTIIAGHGRVLAARQLGFESVPVMTAHGWTEAQKRAYVIADNKLALNADWDAEILAVELDELRDAGFDLELTGFAGAELADLIGTASFGPGGEDDQGRLDKLSEKIVTCPHCGESFDANAPAGNPD
jgi:ParB-like chromosome segregation protein Spo0J